MLVVSFSCLVIAIHSERGINVHYLWYNSHSSDFGGGMVSARAISAVSKDDPRGICILDDQGIKLINPGCMHACRGSNQTRSKPTLILVLAGHEPPRAATSRHKPPKAARMRTSQSTGCGSAGASPGRGARLHIRPRSWGVPRATGAALVFEAGR